MARYQWNPWHGCHKCSPGCLNCYVYYFDQKRGRDASVVTKSKTFFDLPLRHNRQGAYKIPPGCELATCFTSDFFLPEADAWREDAWAIIRQRPDVRFLICTKRIARVERCLPADWGGGYENVILAVTCETQQKAEERLPILLRIPARHKYIFVAPILEQVELRPFLSSGQIECVSVGGESYENARVCNFDWVRQIKTACDQCHVAFDFHQTGSNFVKDNKRYRIRHRDEYSQARKAMAYLAAEQGQ